MGDLNRCVFCDDSEKLTKCRCDHCGGAFVSCAKCCEACKDDGSFCEVCILNFSDENSL